MNITLDSLHIAVERQLSIIGKRSIDDNGNLLFKDITLGTREKEILNDYFENAFIEICGELRKFITAEVQRVSTFASTVYTSFWTDQQPAALVDSVTANGQRLYNYSTQKLYVYSLSFPFQSQTIASGTLFKYNGDFYSYSSGLTQLTEEQVAALTDEQKNAAIVLSYYNPASLPTVNQPDVYAYYNSTIYKSVRQCTFSEESLSATACYYDPAYNPYQWLYGAMQRIVSGGESFELTLDFPSNWNDALQPSLAKALQNYAVAYALYSWFTITAPRIAEKSKLDCERLMASAIMMLHEKLPPVEAASSPLDVHTSVT